MKTENGTQWGETFSPHMPLTCPTGVWGSRASHARIHVFGASRFANRDFREKNDCFAVYVYMKFLSNLRQLHTVFTWRGCSFHLCCLGNSFMINFTSLDFESEAFKGKVWRKYMHKGYSTKLLLQRMVTLCFSVVFSIAPNSEQLTWWENRHRTAQGHAFHNIKPNRILASSRRFCENQNYTC